MKSNNIIVDTALINLNTFFLNATVIIKSNIRFEICRIKMLSGLEVDFYIDDLMELYDRLCFMFPRNNLNSKFVKLHYYLFHEKARLYSGVFEIV